MCVCVCVYSRNTDMMGSNKPEYWKKCEYICMMGAWVPHEYFGRMER